ncbi:hypothetical protein Tco_1245935 [Tanacetum coccineum]
MLTIPSQGLQSKEGSIWITASHQCMYMNCQRSPTESTSSKAQMIQRFYKGTLRRRHHSGTGTQAKQPRSTSRRLKGSIRYPREPIIRSLCITNDSGIELTGYSMLYYRDVKTPSRVLPVELNS